MNVLKMWKIITSRRFIFVKTKHLYFIVYQAEILFSRMVTRTCQESCQEHDSWWLVFSRPKPKQHVLDLSRKTELLDFFFLQTLPRVRGPIFKLFITCNHIRKLVMIFRPYSMLNQILILLLCPK